MAKRVAVRLQYSEPGGIPAFTLPSTFYLQIGTFWRADERTRTADLLITSELFLLDEQPALHLFDLRPVYRTAIKVQVGTICVHVLSNTRK